MSYSRFGRFLLAGGVAALANFGSRILLSRTMPYVPAIVIAYCIGMGTAFVLNKRFVFERAAHGIGKQALWFTLVNLAAVCQTVLISVFLAKAAFPYMGMQFHPETVAHAIGVIFPVLSSYYGHKKYSFRAS